MPHHGGGYNDCKAPAPLKITEETTFREALFFIRLEISCSERDGGKSRRRLST